MEYHSRVGQLLLIEPKHLLALLISANGGRLEIPKDQMRNTPKDVFVSEDPSRNVFVFNVME